MINKLDARLMEAVIATLTDVAAPPILMVVRPWNWNLETIFQHFGELAIATVVVNALVLAFAFRQRWSRDLLHLLMLALLIVNAHHPNTLMAVFLLFLEMIKITEKYQTQLRLKESL